MLVRGGADKALPRPTSRCRSTESIVSLEKGVCSCAELQVFSCYRGWKEARRATWSISTWRRELSSRFFFLARQGAEGNSRYSDRNIRGTCAVSVADPMRNVSWMLFPGGTELGTQVKTGRRAGRTHTHTHSINPKQSVLEFYCV